METLYSLIGLLGVWGALVVGGAVGFCALCAIMDPKGIFALANLSKLMGGNQPLWVLLVGKEDTHRHYNTNIIVWTGLLVLTLIEVGLAYVHLPLHTMLIILIGLSLVKAFLIIWYFMHMKFERFSFVLTIIPATIITLSLISIIFPDGLRVLDRSPLVIKELKENQAREKMGEQHGHEGHSAHDDGGQGHSHE